MKKIPEPSQSILKRHKRVKIMNLTKRTKRHPTVQRKFQSIANKLLRHIMKGQIWTWSDTCTEDEGMPEHTLFNARDG
jgi:hypothetical protein